MTTLVVLPGLDGSAHMQAEFAAAASVAFDVLPIAYPPDRIFDYSALEDLVRDSLPRDRRFVLLGQSFSGPIAISIAADPPAGMMGLVLSTTFAKNPVPWLKPFAGLTRFAPVHALPDALLSWWLLGRWATPALSLSLRKSLLAARPDVLGSRAAYAMRVDVSDSLGRITVPTLALQASADRLLSRSACEQIVSAISGAQAATVSGPHLLLQAAAHACAQRIADFFKDQR